MSRSDKIIRMLTNILAFEDDKLDAVEEAVNACLKVQMLQNQNVTSTNEDHTE